MPIKLFITIDTEEDSWDRYSRTQNTVENVSCLPKLQQIFDRYGAIPTYLINWPVVNDKRARHILLDMLNKGKCEIGTHCHPWNTPPFEEQINPKNTMLCNLSYDLIKKKIEILHSAIKERFNITPVSFRAGRCGFSSEVARAIHNLGYRIDTSVTPLVDWSVYEGPNFSKASSSSYWFNADDILKAELAGCLLEVPVTTGFLQKNFRRCNTIRKLASSHLLSRFKLLRALEILRLTNFRFLSPEMSTASEMTRLSKNFIEAGHRSLNMTFHSPSLLAGVSPFVRNKKELDIFYKNIEMFLRFAVNKGIIFLPLSGALNAARRSRTTS